ncbi:MAG: oligopeptidase A [Acidiferrobacterales bacterium]|nr:oligopeptidase A [Acidiferrobacterales bacterium]
MQDNPLLDLSGLPKFDAILPQHVEPAVDYILGRNRKKINELIETVEEPNWENFMAPLEVLDDELEKVWAPVSHLNGVRDSDELREVYQACLPKLSDYASELGQDKRLFEKVKAIKESDAFAALDAEKRKLIDNALRDFRLSGIDLPEAEQDRFREIASEMSSLCNNFSQNVMDATDAWHIDLTEASAVAGIPDTALDLAAQTARDAETAGWRFTLQGPSYIAVMTYADNAELREAVYRAYVSRASEVGPNAGEWDNSSVMCEILALRQEEASLLGFRNYAALSVETKMAESPEQVSDFLQELSEKSRPVAQKEVEELKTFARDQLGVENLNPWDYAYVSEKLQQHRYAFSQEALRPYFPLPQVLNGMFDIVGRLFGIQVEQTVAPSVWHEDVQFFRINDEKGEARGYFYVDLYARKQKRGGAWMADCVGRRKTSDGMQLPVAFLTCNFSAPVDGKPSLLTHDEMMTLFHEFGHGLHHMLTKVETAGVAGINGVPWDAVELPSQFLENWCWEEEALDLVSGHVDTGEPLPAELLEKMKRARNFQSAMQMCRQLEFSLFDMRIHGDFAANTAADIQAVLDQVRDEVAVIEAPEYNRFQHGFGHIFAGGYAAGYYSYKWAEVLSADAYSKFEENGVFDSKTGRQFLENILEKGGAEEPMALFVAFRGRKPTVEALLRHSGLSQLENAA